MEYRYRAPEPDHSIWWQVALGVFLALLSHSIITGLYTRHEFNKRCRKLTLNRRDLSSSSTACYWPIATMRNLVTWYPQRR